MSHKEDLNAEISILGGLCQYASDAYLDVADILCPDAFVKTAHRVFWNCARHCFEKNNNVRLDEALIISASYEIGYDNFYNRKEEKQGLKDIFAARVELSNVRTFAAKIRKLLIANQLMEQCDKAKLDLSTVNGTESIEYIIGLAESKIFEYNDIVSNKEGQIEKIGIGIDEYLDNLEANPVDIVGISSGYRRYDEAIGGGFRRKELDTIFSRFKVGKSQIVDNVGMWVSTKTGIPVINLDMEMSKEQHWARILANYSGVPKRLIETGKYIEKPGLRAKVRKASEIIKASPYYYDCIGGLPFEDVLSKLRRWVKRDVGVDTNGKAKDCLVIYDYIKLPDSSSIARNIQEYQAIGFLITALKNFLIRYDVPCLAFGQLNRDGIDEADTGSISGSDRIGMYCSSATVFMPKSVEEIAEDGIEHGNRKLIPLVCRNGPGLDSKDYINMNLDGDYGRITELSTKAEVLKQKKHKDSGFIITNDNEDIPFA